jgi:hypothetical protein
VPSTPPSSRTPFARSPTSSRAWRRAGGSAAWGSGDAPGGEAPSRKSAATPSFPPSPVFDGAPAGPSGGAHRSADLHHRPLHPGGSAAARGKRRSRRGDIPKQDLPLTPCKLEPAPPGSPGMPQGRSDALRVPRHFAPNRRLLETAYRLSERLSEVLPGDARSRARMTLTGTGVLESESQAISAGFIDRGGNCGAER